METVTTIAAVHARVRGWRREGRRVAFVPTMGNLHAGHVSLIDAARRHGERFVASIFVNPMQFGPNEDFAHYPRTPREDARMLAEAGCSLMFIPEVGEIYPHGSERVTRVEVPGLSRILEGEFRPGHLEGVSTVVAKLFHIVEPDVAIFGAKDFQQLAVIRRMVADLCMAVEIVAAPTVRDSDGLAMSSRNQYLTAAERALAPQIYAALQAAEALDGRAAQARIDTGRAPSEELRERGGIEAVTDLEVRVRRRLREFVPRTDQLAVVAAVDAIADRFAEPLGDGAPVLDGEVGDAAACIEAPGRDDGSRGAGRNAGLTASAVGAGGLVRRQRQVRQDLAGKEPGAAMARDEVGVLADPAESGVAGERLLEHRRGIDAHPVAEWPDVLLKLRGEPGESASQRLVVVASQRVARHVAEPRVVEHRLRIARIARPIVHARA